jgi:hypothetical protein
MKPLFLCLTLLLLVGCRTQLSAPNAADIDNAEKGSATFLQTLTAEDRKKYDYLEADWLKYEKGDRAAYKKIYQQSVLQSQAILGRLGYGTLFTGTLDDRTRNALLQYQKKTGIFESGNVDPPTYFALKEDDSVLDDRLVITSPFSFSAEQWNEHFSATGAWDYKNKDSVMSSSIECVKSSGLCTETDAHESTLFWTYLLLVTNDFTITKWDDHRIEAVHSVACENDQLIVVRDEQTVTMHGIPTDPDSVSCTKLAGNVVIVGHLKDGIKLDDSRRETVEKKRKSLFQFSENAQALLQAPKD